MQFPRLLVVRQKFPDRKIPDVAAEVRNQLAAGGFAGRIESGLFKMMAIGLGKFAGAQRYHCYAYRLGLEHVIRSVGRQVLKSGKILGGLAILEDAYHNTARLDAVAVEHMEQREEENLALAKSWMGKIPSDLDILIQ